MDLLNNSLKIIETKINEEHFKHETMLVYNDNIIVDDNYKQNTYLGMAPLLRIVSQANKLYSKESKLLSNCFALV